MCHCVEYLGFWSGNISCALDSALNWFANCRLVSINGFLRVVQTAGFHARLPPIQFMHCLKWLIWREKRLKGSCSWSKGICCSTCCLRGVLSRSLWLGGCCQVYESPPDVVGDVTDPSSISPIDLKAGVVIPGFFTDSEGMENERSDEHSATLALAFAFRKEWENGRIKGKIFKCTHNLAPTRCHGYCTQIYDNNAPYNLEIILHPMVDIEKLLENAWWENCRLWLKINRRRDTAMTWSREIVEMSSHYNHVSMDQKKAFVLLRRMWYNRFSLS